jgi:drug/metabolite transporter (DMT)-like permease
MLFFSGLELTTPVHASLILTTSPILVLLFSNLMLKTPVTWRKVVGIATGFAGALALVGLGKQMGAGENILVGDLFILGNATAYALYLVLVKKLINKYPPLTVMKWVFTTGLIFVIPFGFGQLGEIEWSRFTAYTWGAVLYVIICVTFLAYLLNIYALQRVAPATVGFYIYLQPLLAAFMSAMVGMESIDAVKVISGVLIFLGVFLVSDIPLKPRKTAA